MMYTLALFYTCAHVTRYSYMKNFAHTCTVRKLIIRKVFFENFDYKNYLNYKILAYDNVIITKTLQQ